MSDVKSAAKRRNEKNKKKMIDKEIKRRKMGFIGLLALGVIITFILINLWNNIEKIRNRTEQTVIKEQDYKHLKTQNDANEEKLREPYDDEYIVDAVRQFGYGKFDEIKFYLPKED